jgi:hypothetical protein
MPNPPIITRGSVTIDSDDDGIYIRTSTGEVETVTSDAAMEALVRVKELELLVEQLTETVESLLKG